MLDIVKKQRILPQLDSVKMQDAEMMRPSAPIAARVGYVLFAALSLLVALVSLRALVSPLPLAMPNMAHYLDGRSLPLWGHVLAGPLALALAPLQMSARLRTRAPALHRRTGYVALAAILVGAVSALALLPDFTGSRFAAAGFATLGTLWLGFAALGLAAARRGDTPAHRRFMLRATALTFGAVTLRLMMAPLMAAGWSVDETYQVTAWGCWLPGLALTEVLLRRGRNAKGRR